jgi:WD40 repeat protein
MKLSQDEWLVIFSFLPFKDVLKTVQYVSKTHQQAVNNKSWLQFQYFTNQNEKINFKKEKSSKEWKQLIFIQNEKQQQFTIGNLPNKIIFENSKKREFVTCMKIYKNLDESQDVLLCGTKEGTMKIFTQDFLKKDQIWKLKKKIKPHFEEISCIEFENDFIVSGSFDETVSVVDKELNVVQTLKGHEDWVREVKYIKKKDQILSSSRDKTIKLWDVLIGECLATLRHEKRMPWCLEYSNGLNTELLLSGSSDGFISIWDLKSNSLQSSNSSHRDIVTSIKWISNDKMISSSFDKSIKLWDIRKMKHPIKEIQEHQSSICSMDFDGKTLVTCSTNGELKSFDTNLKLLQTHVTPYSAIYNEPLLMNRLCSCKIFNGGIFCNNDEPNAVIHWRIENGISSNTFKVSDGFFHSFVVDTSRVVGSVVSQSSHLVEYATEVFLK